MKCILLAAVFFFVPGLSHSQDHAFPQTWVGHWKGELQWFKTGRAAPQQVPMELRIQPGDSAGTYTWQILYGKAGEDNRPYLLKPVDKAAGHWVIDERNGIVLDQFWVANRFCGAFTVQQNTIVNIYHIEDGRLVVEFYSLGAKPLNTTGEGTADSPHVDSYRIGSYQKAVLRKMN